jgi:hypothetical protein
MTGRRIFTQTSTQQFDGQRWHASCGRTMQIRSIFAKGQVVEIIYRFCRVLTGPEVIWTLAAAFPKPMSHAISKVSTQHHIPSGLPEHFKIIDGAKVHAVEMAKLRSMMSSWTIPLRDRAPPKPSRAQERSDVTCRLNRTKEQSC